MDICIFSGRSTREPIVTQTNNGMMARFSLAVETGYGENKKANFFDFVSFGKTAESIERFIRQGTKIVVQAEAQQNIWEDKEGGTHRDVNFVVRSWEFAESKKDGDTPAPARKSVQQKDADQDTSFMNIDNIDEDVPFA